MATTAQPNPPASATSEPLKSFVDMPNYAQQYDELCARGTVLTDEEKRKYEQICKVELGAHDAGSVFNPSIFHSIAYTLFSFIQNIFTGNFSSIKDMFSNLGSSMNLASAKNTLSQAQEAAARISEDLKAQGGNLAAAAELLTGVKPFTDNSPSNTLASNILNQVGKSSGLPVTTDTSLNPKPATLADATMQTGLPPRPTTQPLTPRL